MEPKATPQQSAISYNPKKIRNLQADRVQHQHTMEEEHSIKISTILRTHLREIHSENGLIHQNMTIINVDRNTDHQETGPPPQAEIFIPETAADLETGTTASLRITIEARITGIAAGFLETPRITVGKIAQIHLTQRLTD